MKFIKDQINLFIHFVNTIPNALVYLAIIILVLAIFNVLTNRIKSKLLSSILFFGFYALTGFAIAFFFSQYITLYLVVIIFPTWSLGIALSLIINPSASQSNRRQEKGNPFSVRFETNKGTFYFDLIRGFAIFGASGSGKTKSGFLPVIKHCADHGLSGIIYDYKDFELTKLVYYFFKDSPVNLYTIYLTDPEFSHKINPIDPRYIDTMADMRSVIQVFIDNLAASSGDKGNDIFIKIATAALGGVAWRLKEDYPEKCTLPYACGILLMQKTESVAEFIQGNTYASLMGAPFLDSLGSEKQMAAVKASLSTAILQIMTPEISMILSGSDFDLRLNLKENPSMMTMVNNITLEEVHSPIIATIVQATTRMMSKLDRNPSLVLLDEGSTIKLRNLAKMPATLRSFGIGTVWGLQDKVQGAIMYDENTLKAILTNLSTKMLGKVNDPDTARWYENLFEIVEVEQRSYSRSDDLLSSDGTRVNISKKEQARHRGQEFMKLRKGQFFMFDEYGDSQKLQFKMPKFKNVDPKPIYNYSSAELKLNFDNLLEECRNFS